MRRILLLLCLSALPIACADPEATQVWQARSSFDAGDLEGAERALTGCDGDDARRLRSEITLLKSTRAEVDAECARMESRATMQTLDADRATLTNMRSQSKDSVSRARIDTALGKLPQIATQKAAAAKAKAEADAQEEMAAAAAAVTERKSQVLNEIRRAIAKREWKTGLDTLKTATDAGSADAEDLKKLRRDLIDAALIDIRDVQSRAVAAEREQGSKAAYELLQGAISRFPPIDEFESIHLLLGDLSRRAAEDKRQSQRREEKAEREKLAARAPLLANQPAPEGKTVGQLVVLAQENARNGELAFARECWLAASQKTFPGDWRDDYVGEAQDLRARLTLRDELAKAWKAAPKTFAKLGVTAVDALGWTADGAHVAWDAISYDAYTRVGHELALSKLARRGMIAEVLASSSNADRERVIGELAALSKQGEFEVADAANMVARARGGLGTTERFELHEGRWATRGALEAERVALELAKLKNGFARAGNDARDAAWDAYSAAAGEEAASAALLERANTAVANLKKNATLEQLASLAELRRELDDARAAALAAIFDEETYFYPYNPPEPPKTAGDYARASRHVDELVGLVHAAWEQKKSVHVPKDFRAAVDEYLWCAETAKDTGLAIESVPEYVLSVPLELETLDLATFAWGETEAGDLAYSRRVEARNEAMWRALEGKNEGVEPASIPDHAEREQVRITNAYRRMLGRRALAWNPRIQVAAQGHSDYMANTGDFGHFEKDPARHGPGDRMKLAGYNAGVSENCAMGGGDPKTAHDGWCHSSGHHRNLLMPDHREMASGVAGFYWTQNFGVDSAFVSELDPQ